MSWTLDFFLVIMWIGLYFHVALLFRSSDYFAKLLSGEVCRQEKKPCK